MCRHVRFPKMVFKSCKMLELESSLTELICKPDPPFASLFTLVGRLRLKMYTNKQGSNSGRGAIMGLKYGAPQASLTAPNHNHFAPISLTLI